MGGVIRGRHITVITLFQGHRNRVMTRRRANSVHNKFGGTTKFIVVKIKGKCCA